MAPAFLAQQQMQATPCQQLLGTSVCLCSAFIAMHAPHPFLPPSAQTTVAEALAFSAHLRLPTTVDATTRHAFVEEVSGGACAVCSTAGGSAGEGPWPAPCTHTLGATACRRLCLPSVISPPPNSNCHPSPVWSPPQIMALVELTRLRHAYVGVPGVSGLSVEQRKRLTLAGGRGLEQLASN